MGAGEDPALVAVVARAQRLGLVGRRADVDVEVARCRAFCDPLADTSADDVVVDLGSGNGLPGLVAARCTPARVWLVEAAESRCDFLRWAVSSLELSERVTVVEGRAEEVARDPRRRGAAQFVVARSFGPPATTAECAVGFLGPGGQVLVAEPPDPGGERWPRDGLAALGLRDGGLASGGVRRLILSGPVDDRWPRRPSVPRRRPLF